jgi:hypothetical protein
MLWLWLLIPLLILLVLLAVPVMIYADLSIGENNQLQILVRWTVWSFQRWQWQIPTVSDLLASLQPTQGQSGPSSPSKRKTDRKQKSGLKRGLPWFETWETGWGLLAKYWPRVWAVLHFRLVSATWRVQLDDPAHLGWLYAAAGALDWPKTPIVLQIDYGDTNQFCGDTHWSVRLHPGQVLWLLLSFAWEQPIRTLIRARICKKGEKENCQI